MKGHELKILSAPPSDGEARCECGLWAMLSTSVSSDTREAYIKHATEKHRQHLASVRRRQQRENTPCA